MVDPPRPHAAAVSRAGGWTLLQALLCAGTLIALWVALDPRTADLAAQVYRANLFGREGFALWDNGWFAGHHLPGYSLLFPPLAAAFGPRTVGVGSVLVSALLFAHLVRLHWPGREVRLAVAWFALAAVGDLFIGRLTFALGVTFALGCVVALSHRRWPLAVALGVATAAASPVTALLLVVVLPAGIRAVAPRWRPLVLGGPLVVPVATAVLFPEGGAQPYGAGGAALAIIIALGVWAGLDPREKELRTGALLYAVAVAGAFAVPSPMGSNVARLGVLVAGPVLLLGARSGRSRLLTAATCLLIVGWQLWAPVTELIKADTSPATTASYFQPLLDRLKAEPHGRVEVVPTSTRWESVYVAPHVALARGWQTQLDARYNALFYRDELDAGEYEAWLRRLGITHVAVSDAPKERWGQLEERLLADPPPYLREVWRSDHWRLFALTDPQPLASGGRLTRLDGDSFTVATTHPGRVLVRIRWTPFWTPPPGACVERSARGFTLLGVPGPGSWEVRADWSVGAALGDPARACDEPS
ncbi:hypothetical protein Q5424_06285 [Conexibacter sp. JD483]|uniref:hypothetical protein n=1 Tax=unclassified Conexibacter TaxID=2627773 RepID=UPI00271D276A|nr:MULTISPECIES: hypothetical protein [unclassified Conexibacter]MDO8184835.1 hypothetical protein [Conexibacter sp. CPCC 205706]MDO8196610.1 hypothetical protein [Conexibacter sp. CPCC 205762]MDR9368677.1 hypothetical protein [Conexibacter sp. JD483]